MLGLYFLYGTPLSDPTSSWLIAVSHYDWSKYCISDKPIAQFMARPTMTHLTVAKRVLCYVKSSLDFGLIFGLTLVSLL